MTIRLQTSRLALRPVAPDDLPSLHAHWSDPEVRRYLWDGRTPTLDEVRQIISISRELFGAQEAGLWVVERSPSAALIGCAGFWDFHEPPEREIVLSLGPDSWGLGLALECATALLDYAFDELGWSWVQGSTDPPNERSLKLIERLGLRRTGERPGVFGPSEVFRISQAEWRSRSRVPPGVPTTPAT